MGNYVSGAAILFGMFKEGQTERKYIRKELDKDVTEECVVPRSSAQPSPGLLSILGILL